MSEFQDALTKVKKNVDSFKQIIDNRMTNVDKLFSDMAKFLEASKNVVTMLEATGAEIEGNGRANKTTVLGKKRGFLQGKRQTGASLLDYYREKIYLLKDMHALLLRITTTLTAEEHLDKDLRHEMQQEIASVASAEERGENRKLKHLRKLLEKADDELRNEAKRNERDEKLVNKELDQFNKAYKDVIAQASRLKGLCKSFAKRNYNRVAKYERRERKIILHIIKNQTAFIKTFSADTKELIRFLKQYEKELKWVQQGRDPEEERFKHELKKALKHLKNVRKLERKERRFEKSIPKLHKLQDTGESEDADELDHDIEQEEHAMEDIEQKEDLLKGVIASLEKIDEYISGVLGQGTKIATTFDFHLNYLTDSLLSAKKMLKRKPDHLKDFLQKIVAYAEKNVKDDLEAARREEEQLRDSFKQGAEQINELTKDANHIIFKTDRSLTNYFSDIKRGMDRINSDLEKKFTRELKKIGKQRIEEEKARKDDKKLRKKARTSGLETDRKDIKDMKRQERNLDEDEKKFQEHQQQIAAYKHQFDQALAHTKSVMPSFRDLQKKIISQKSFKRLSTSVEQHFKRRGEGERALEKVNNEFIAWTGNPFHVSSYVEMMDGLKGKTADDLIMLKSLERIYKSLAANEHDLTVFFAQLQATIESFKNVHAALGNYESLIKEHLENSDKIYADTKNVYDAFNKELQTIKDVEQSLQTMTKGNDLLLNAAERYEQTVEFFHAHAKEVRKKLGKEDDWGNQVRPTGLHALNQ